MHLYAEPRVHYESVRTGRIVCNVGRQYEGREFYLSNCAACATCGTCRNTTAWKAEFCRSGGFHTCGIPAVSAESLSEAEGGSSGEGG